MLKQLIETKRCILVTGGGGVGKTTLSASLAVAAARVRPRVLVLTIDPARRLLQAFGFTDALLQEGGEPLLLSDEVKAGLGLGAGASLSVAVMNPKYVIDQIIDQTMAGSKAGLLRSTVLYREMTQMIHGLTEYTAYEWVTRLIQEDRYDLIVLDTPPAFHAKDFFLAPDRIRNLMESRVFQLFLPKSRGWFQSVLSLGWIEKLLGERLYRESSMFFETFMGLRNRILERCSRLSGFFKDPSVAVLAVGTPESTPFLELEGLMDFLARRNITLEGVVLNQMEDFSADPDPGMVAELPEGMREKLRSLRDHQNSRAERHRLMESRFAGAHPGLQVLPVAMVYSSDGFEILRHNSEMLLPVSSGDKEP
jgi:anion-transporting  ArsA/GET3 family ATPase